MGMRTTERDHVVNRSLMYYLVIDLIFVVLNIISTVKYWKENCGKFAIWVVLLIFMIIQIKCLILVFNGLGGIDGLIFGTYNRCIDTKCYKIFILVS
jgi:cytochrome c oxidase subunit IV